MRRKWFKNWLAEELYVMMRKTKSKTQLYKDHMSIQIPLLTCKDHARIEIPQLMGNDCE